MVKVDFYQVDGKIPYFIRGAIYNSILDMIGGEYAKALSKNYGIKATVQEMPAYKSLNKEKFIRAMKTQVNMSDIDEIDSETLYTDDNENIDIVLFANVVEFIYSQLNDYSVLEEYGIEYYSFVNVETMDQKQSFLETVNQILERNNLPYHLNIDGQFRRTIDKEFENIVKDIVPSMYQDIDIKISRAKQFILSTDREVRLDSLKELWDAYESFKTSIDYVSLPESIGIIFNNIFSEQPEFKSIIENDFMRFLNNAGNQLKIRHFKTTTESIKDDKQIDFLYRVMLSFLTYVIQLNSQGGTQ